MTCISVSWPYEKGSEGVSAGFDQLQSILENLDNTQSLITLESDYNTFILLTSSDTGNDKIADVMAMWQSNFFGEVLVVYGQMTKENLQLLQLGNLQMTHYGVSIQPMPKACYEQLRQLQTLQSATEKAQDANHQGIADKDYKKFKSLEKGCITNPRRNNREDN